MTTKFNGFLILVLLFSLGFASNTKAQEISEEERMEWWTDARFGMFIHWGIYSVPAGFHKGEVQTNSAEWIMYKGEIPLSEYEEYADLFNPTLFNPKTFVGLAKEAGMKYIVITSKHHDGFSMFHSESNPFNIVDATPYGKDIIKELAAECAEQDIKFGFYYSQAQDWSHPGGIGNTWDKTMQRVSSDVYVREKALPEVHQLLTEYGDISIFWWDTPREMSKEVIDSLHHITRALQPGIITNDRLGEDYPGDHKSYERHMPKKQPEEKYWELCQPVSGSWGYRSDDQNFKPLKKLLGELAEAASMGGNYLLNVSPTCLGTLAPTAVERMTQIGAWMDKNSESIYETEASPCGKVDWGYITMKQDGKKTKLYLHVFDWESGSVHVPIKNKSAKAYLLTDAGKSFEYTPSKEGLTIKLQGDAPDAINSVIVLEVEDKLSIIPPKPFGQNEDGVVIFNTYDVEFENLQGFGITYNNNRDYVGNWEHEQERAYWDFAVDKPGEFVVLFKSSYEADTEFTVEINGEIKTVKNIASDKSNKFSTQEVGTFKIKKKGDYKIYFRPTEGKWSPIRLKDVVITPVK